MQFPIPVSPTDTLAALVARSTTPVPVSDAALSLGWTEDEVIAAAKQLNRMGLVVWHRHRIYPKSLVSSMQGTVVESANGQVRAALSNEMSVYVSPRSARRVLHGDVVLWTVLASSSPEALPDRILSRPEPFAVGRVDQQNGAWVVVQERRPEPWTLTLETRDYAPRINDVVLVRMPKRTPIRHDTQVWVHRLLGHATDPGIESTIAEVLWKIPTGCPEPITQAAMSLAAPSEDGREDWTHMPFITIDGPDSQDLDDAICAETTPQGLCLRVAIADVASAIPAGSVLDQHACLRGTSVYLPHRVHSMLPRRVAHDLCSLVQGVRRAAIGCEMWVDASGQATHVRFARVVISVHARLTYEGVDRLLDGGDLSAEPWAESLAGLLDFSNRCRQSRRRIESHSGDTEVVLDDQGQPIGLRTHARGPSSLIVEDCMLATNVAAAQWLVKAGMPALFRSQAAPSTEICAQARTALGEAAPEDDSACALMVLSSPRRPETEALRDVLLAALGPAEYTSEASLHFSLQVPVYLHVTSPIRRYPDLLMQRQILHTLGGGEMLSSEFLHGQGVSCTQLSRAASGAETEARKMLLAAYVSPRAPRDMTATVVDCRAWTVLIQAEGIPASLPARALSGWHYVAPKWISPTGEMVGIGAFLDVHLESADVRTRRIFFALPAPPIVPETSPV